MAGTNIYGQLIKAQLENLAADPASPATGLAYFNTTSNVSKWYTGAAWKVAIDADSTQTLTNKTLTAPAISSPTGLVKGDVGLGNVDNTSDATKNSATVTLSNKTLASPLISGGSVDTTAAGAFTLGASVGANSLTLGGATSTVVVAGNLTVSGTTTTVNSTTLDVADKNITVDKGGNDAASEGAGLTVDRTGTKGSLIYALASPTRFKIGDLASEADVVSISAAQTLTNKTISGASNTISNVSLTTGVTGILPTANGGTAQNSTATFPTSGTVATLSNNLGSFASTTSAQLASVLSDETGSGAAVFGTAPTLAGPVISTFENFTSQGADPATPAGAGDAALYVKSNLLYTKDSTGLVTQIGASTKVIVDTVWDGATVLKDTTVASDARNMQWSLQDNANGFETMYVSIKSTSATNVRVTVGTALPAGTYRLIGV